jgi:putative aldouronate transport system substrate-binding protein
MLTYGVQEVEYRLDTAGNPIPLDAWREDVNNMPWRYTVQRPQVLYFAGNPELTRAQYDAEQELIPVGVSDPTLGYYSPTASAKKVVLTNTMFDALTQILAGRSSMSDYDRMVAEWRTNGGEQIRKEYMDAMASAA